MEYYYYKHSAINRLPMQMGFDQGNREYHLQMTIFPPIPRETARAALSVFGRSNFYLIAGDLINDLIQGLNTQQSSGRQLSLSRNQAMLYLITIFQYRETMPDHLVPDALHERLDWKYALHLPINYAHLNALTLCEVRQQLLTSPLEMQYLQALIQRLAASTMLAGDQLQNIPAQRIVARVCLFTRAATIWEAINRTLEALAIRQPEWLLDNSLPHWFERYDPIHKSLNLNESDEEIIQYAQTIGQDGAYLLKEISESKLPSLSEIPEVSHLKAVWQEQYSQIEGKAIFRQATCAGCILAVHPSGHITQ